MWENSLLSLQAGAYLSLDVRRQSTYLISAELADQIVKNKSEKHQEILSNQLNEWVGEDWRDLLHGKHSLDQEYLHSEIEANP